MGRGLTRSRSKDRMTAMEKRDDTRKRSFSKLKEKLDRPAEEQNWEDSDDEYSDAPYELEEENIQTPSVMERYKIAANFTQEVLQKLVEECVPGASTRELCKSGDERIEALCATVFNKKDEDGEKVFKGIAFPTNISCNDLTAHFAPVEGEGEDYLLQDGDIAKIHLACQVDGYVSQVAHTVIVGDVSRAHPQAQDVAQAAYHAAELASRIMRPDLQNTNEAVTNMYERVGKDFGVNVSEGVLSHRVLRWNQIGHHTIIARKVTDRDEQFQDVEDVFFGPNEVWHIDIVMSSCHEKLHCSEQPTSIFRRNEILLAPRIKATHYVLQAVREKYQMFPFCTRNFSDFARAKLGLKELVRLDMVDPMPVMKTKKQDVTARFSWTIMLTPKGVVRLTGLPLGENIKSQKSLIDPSCKNILKASMLAPSHPQRQRKARKDASKKQKVAESSAMDAD
eukprot:TRINITY_DN8370_c0_g1_i1.p1 TRINITY_DN8370_c0_g1~~TRINITY_DN8370_c0_g1_i1.p1  ORF type:complete len:451 (+),score=219.86 TRINITY_DN8370_c0_g1_i1:94-1446(+)